MKKVTVITPYYRGEKTIFNTINSVFNSYENVKDEINLEYIVIIDSMEDRDKIFKKLKNEYKDKIILLKNQENLGVAKSRNKAIKLATGDYVIFLDQDDNLDKNYFTYIKNNIEADSKVILVNGYICNKVNGKKAPLYYVRPKLRRKTFLRANKISTPGQVVFSKSIINNNFFTGCSEEFKGADDWAAYINMFLNNPNLKIDYISKKLFYYNLHGNNYSNNWAELNSSAIETSKYSAIFRAVSTFNVFFLPLFRSDTILGCMPISLHNLYPVIPRSSHKLLIVLYSLPIKHTSFLCNQTNNVNTL